MSLQAGTQAVLAGAVSATVTGTFTLPYQVGVLAGWATDRLVVPASKTAAQFVVQFTVPPNADSSFDWSVTPTSDAA